MLFYSIYDNEPRINMPVFMKTMLCLCKKEWYYDDTSKSDITFLNERIPA